MVNTEIGMILQPKALRGNLKVISTVKTVFKINFKQVLYPRTHKNQEDEGILEKYSE